MARQRGAPHRRRAGPRVHHLHGAVAAGAGEQLRAVGGRGEGQRDGRALEAEAAHAAHGRRVPLDRLRVVRGGEHERAVGAQARDGPVVRPLRVAHPL